MSRTLQFFLFVAVVALAGATLGALDARFGPSRVEEIRLINSLDVQPQNASGRTWRRVHFEKSLTIGGTGPRSLMHPSIIRVDDLDNIYILDAGERVIKKFDARGELSLRFGEGRGSGAGKFEFPTDFMLARNGNVWVTDANKNSISIFNSSGVLQEVVAVDGAPFRILDYFNGGYMLMLLSGRNHLFEVYSENGKKVLSFGKILEDQAKNAFALEGWIADNGSGGITYVPYRFGLIGSFSYGGKLNFLSKPVHTVPLPSIDIDRNGIRRIGRENRVFAASAGNVKDSIYVVVAENGSKDYCDTIDFYDGENGRYLESQRLPERCRMAFWIENSLYTVKDLAVTKWEIQ